MSEKSYSISLKEYQVLPTPAMVGPRDQIDYHDSLVAEEINRVFGYLLPVAIREGDEIRYFCDDGHGNDLCATAHAPENKEGIPKSELGKLMGAWFSIRMAAEQDSMDTRVRAIFRNFRLPNPDKELGLYRLSTDDQGVQRLHIGWGVEKADTKSSCIDANKAFAKLLDCDTEVIDERWKQFHVENKRKLIVPGTTSSHPVAIDPRTGAVRVQTATGSVQVNPHTGQVVTTGTQGSVTGPVTPLVEPEARGGKLASLSLPALIGIIIGAGVLLVGLLYLIIF